MTTALIKRKIATKKPVKKAVKKAAAKKRAPGDIAASYNHFKNFGTKQYTGMQVGRSHKWFYDKGEWKETKITPDLWRISYAVTKRRAGRAPRGSGVPVGTAYQWYILAHQRVQKLNANDYSTSLVGLKYKVAHKRADKEKWSLRTATQRAHLIQFLKEWIEQLEKEIVPLEFEYDGHSYKGEGIPLPEACQGGVCFQLDITLNDENLGIIVSGKKGWKMELVKDQEFIDAIGDVIMRHYD